MQMILRKLTKCIFFFIAALYVGNGFCANNLADNEKPTLEIPIVSAEVSADLTSYLVLGPFSSNNDTKSIWSTDSLSRVGFSEGLINEAQLMEAAVGLQQLKYSNIGPARASTVTGNRFVDLQSIFGRPHQSGVPPTTAYAACDISAKSDSSAFLLLGCAGGMKVWLNGKTIGFSDSDRGAETFQYAFELNLHTGKNLLVIKLSREKSPTWGFVGRLEPNGAAAAASSLKAQHGLYPTLLKHRLISSRNSTLVFDYQSIPKHLEFEASVSDMKGNVLSSEQVELNSSRWPLGKKWADGVYNLSVSLAAETFKETFYVGDFGEKVVSLSNWAKSIALNDRARINVDTLVKRLTTIQQSTRINNLQSERQAADKYLFTICELESILEAVQQGKDPFTDAVGLHIRGFVSDIDGAVQNYRIYIPGAYRRSSDHKLPLVILLPTATSADKAFVESVFIAQQEETERICSLAQKYGFAILWPGYRSQPSGSQCEFTHLDEVLKEVSKDYEFDYNRLFLLGACSGGALATIAASHWPDRFAAIGLINPVFHIAKQVDPEHVQMFIRFNEFREWYNHTSDVESFFRSASVPTYIVYDGAEPGHGDIENAVEFCKQADKFQYPVRLQQRSQVLMHHLEAWEFLMETFSNIRRDNFSEAVNKSFVSVAGSEKSLAVALANPFVVVVGTGGTDAERKGAQAIADTFQESWRRIHYCDCRVVLDRDYVANANRFSVLVLIGNANTNTVWRDHVNPGEVFLGSDEIKINGRTWKGEELGVQAILLSHQDTKPNIVVIGANRLDKAKFSNVGLSTEGWYSFAIWKSLPNGCEVIDAGVW